MADFLIRFGMSPVEYRALTLLERDVIIKTYNEANTH